MTPQDSTALVFIASYSQMVMREAQAPPIFRLSALAERLVQGLQAVQNV
jgi:hypothetical protein